MKTSVLVSLVSSLAVVAAYPSTYAPIQASVTLSGDSKVKGTIHLISTSDSAPTTIHYDITGLDPNADRGFHIHTSGDLSTGCAGAGAHYNPQNVTHGGPTDAVRHVGDLGNIKSNAQGVAKGSITDKWVKLSGPTSVLNRAIVVHGGTDDLGKGSNADSKTTGNAGARPACGVIKLASQ